MGTERPLVRMKDVAEAIGCSIMTVSLALRNNRQVSEQMRERIVEQARKMGYRPNPFVSSLVAWRRKPGHTDADILVVLTKFGKGQKIWKSDPKNYFYTRLWNGLSERSAELGFRLEEVPVEGTEEEGKRLTRIFLTRGIKGVILFPSGNLEQEYPPLNWRHFVPVAAAFHDPGLTVHRVASDHAMAMEIALHQVEAAGYRHAGLAMTSTMDSRIRHAMSGRFLAWQLSTPLAGRVPLIDESTSSVSREAFVKWFRKHRPDVVLSLSPDHHEWLRAIKLKEAQRAGFIHLAREESSTLSGIDLQSHEVGRSVIDILTRELYLNRYGTPDVPELILIKTEWREGTTLPRR